MQQQAQFLLLNCDEFKEWLSKNTFTRSIRLIQNHHTWEPSYKHFKGDNHFAMLQSMRDYHVTEQKFEDIAQNITTFPDGLIAICRSFEKNPACIYGVNQGAICIENVGNFDTDTMTEEQKKTIVFVNAVLCMKFGLEINTESIVYHHWFDLNTGRRTNGSGSTKTCPGENFFGGNSVEACKSSFIPLVREVKNDIENPKVPSWKLEGLKYLHDKGLLNDYNGWKAKIDEPMPVWAATIILSRIAKQLLKE